MIEPNKYYPKQMNGPLISALGAGEAQQFSDPVAIQDYLYNLSIDTAKETELENIGRIIGFVRPLVPKGFNSENIMLIGTLPLGTDEQSGLSTLNSQIGGTLSTMELSDTGFMSLGLYRKFLKSMAFLKRYGITINSVARVVSIIDNSFNINFNEDKDIVVTFQKNIGYRNVWILTQLFYRIATEPQVLISTGEEE